jgi:hypothetical protein
MNEPQSVTVLLRTENPRPLSVDLRVPYDTRVRRAVICYVESHTVQFVTPSDLSPGIEVTLDLPATLSHATGRVLGGTITARKALSSAERCNAWLYSCRLNTPMNVDQIREVQNCMPNVNR